LTLDQQPDTDDNIEPIMTKHNTPTYTTVLGTETNEAALPQRVTVISATSRFRLSLNPRRATRGLR
jgi:hypothetical protein